MDIPAVKTSLGLNAVVDRCFAAPGSGMSVENMKVTSAIRAPTDSVVCYKKYNLRTISHLVNVSWLTG